MSRLEDLAHQVVEALYYYAPPEFHAAGADLLRLVNETTRVLDDTNRALEAALAREQLHKAHEALLARTLLDSEDALRQVAEKLRLARQAPYVKKGDKSA